MTPRLIALAATPPQPWRNGGGVTRELLAWPAGGGWQVRVSVAEIEADGPFSPFRRCLSPASRPSTADSSPARAATST